MSTLRIHLFGPLRVYHGQHCIQKFPTWKTQHLFCYLVLNRHQAHPRSHLASLFWGNTPEDQARKSLRTSLWRLRSVLDSSSAPDPGVLLVENDEIQLNPDLDYWLDVEEFEKRLTSLDEWGGSKPGRHADASAVSQRLTEAIELYAGDLLQGSYEDWCLYERERLQEMFLSALTRLMRHHSETKAYAEAILCGQRILTYDPLLEEIHRELMRLHWLLGNRGAAIRQYKLCVARLARELNIEPMTETIALYHQICQRHQRERRSSARSASSAASSPRATVPTEQRARSAMTSHIATALSELQQVEAEIGRMGVHFQRGVEILETIRRELRQTEGL